MTQVSKCIQTDYQKGVSAKTAIAELKPIESELLKAYRLLGRYAISNESLEVRRAATLSLDRALGVILS